MGSWGWFIVDELDKAIMVALDGNGRVSYQVLARRLGVSYNAVKKRVNRLLEVGAIMKFAIELSLAMLDADFFNALIKTDGSEDLDLFMEQLGQRPEFFVIRRFADGSYFGEGSVVGAQGLIELGRFLRRLPVITNVELHPAVLLTPVLSSRSKGNTRGQKVTFTAMQLQVLRCLVEDPRMSITTIARQSGLTPRRIRTILKELQEGGGLHITVRWDRSSFGDIELVVLIQYDDTTTTPSEIFEWFKDQYPFEYWVSAIWADEPTVVVSLTVKDLRAAEAIGAAVKAAPFTKDAMIRVSYPHRRFQGLLDTGLRDLLVEAGYRAE